MKGYMPVRAYVMMLAGTNIGWVIGTALYHHWAVCT